MKKIINTSKAPLPVGPYNQAVQFDNTLYISGQVAIIPENNEIIKGSIEDAYEFVYQASPKGGNLFGDLAKSVIKGHADYPFIISALMLLFM